FMAVPAHKQADRRIGNLRVIIYVLNKITNSLGKSRRSGVRRNALQKGQADAITSFPAFIPESYGKMDDQGRSSDLCLLLFLPSRRYYSGHVVKKNAFHDGKAGNYSSGYCS